MGENRVVALSSEGSDQADEDESFGESTGLEDDGFDDEGARFDLGSGAIDPDLLAPQIPRSCVLAWKYPSNMGCTFYAVDLDQAGLNDHDPWGVVVVNVQPDLPATVEIKVEIGGSWLAVVDEDVIAPGQAAVYPLPDLPHEGSGVFDDAAYRIVTDVPVAVTQLSPVTGGLSWRSGASLLHPTEAWTPETHVMGWHTEFGIGQPAYVSVIAAVDATTVSVVPSMRTAAGPGVPAGEKGVLMQASIGSGELLQLAAQVDEIDPEDGLTGTVVATGDEHPVAVFTAHACAGIPSVQDNECGHMQEQMSMHLQGTRFAVARLPVHHPSDPEPMLLHLYGLEDDTKIEFEAGEGTLNLPLEGLTLDRGDSYRTHVTGLTANAGHFAVRSEKPILMAAYVENAPPGGRGSPSMVQIAPVERWLSEYRVYAPPGWDEHTLVISRAAGVAVSVDGTPVDDALFEPFGDWEAAHVPVDAGVHRVLAEDPVSLTVEGAREHDAYATLGGWATPTPLFPPPK